MSGAIRRGASRAISASRVIRVAVLGLAIGMALGCGPLSYVRGVSGDADDAVEEARRAEAEKLAPYWWTRATAYLARARHEAADADWQAANRFGRLAEEAARKAVEEAAKAKADPSLRPLEEPVVAPAKESSLSPGLEAPTLAQVRP